MKSPFTFIFEITKHFRNFHQSNIPKNSIRPCCNHKKHMMMLQHIASLRNADHSQQTWTVSQCFSYLKPNLCDTKSENNIIKCLSEELLGITLPINMKEKKGNPDCHCHI